MEKSLEKSAETLLPQNLSIITGHFQEGPGYAVSRPHGTDDFLLMLTLQGRGRVGHGGGSLVCAAGAVVLLRPGALHDYETDRETGDWEFVWSHFVVRPHWLSYVDTWPERAAGLQMFSLLPDNAEVFSHVRAALLEMHRRAQSGLPRRGEFALNSLEEALLWCDTVNPQRFEARWDPRVARSMNYMREHLREPVTLSQLSDLVGLSESRLSHLFHEQIGQTPQRFLEAQRIDRAQQLLLLTGRSVAEIAEEVGYENPFYFTLRFKKCVGCSPRAWRLQQQQKQIGTSG